ncbi:MAG: aspartate-semialdehyde dehydrogenase [Pseudomonadota bacterium]
MGIKALAVLALASGLALAACDSNNVPSPAERLNNPNASVDADMASGLVLLNPQGLSVGAESFFFAAGEAEVTRALNDLLGEPGARVEQDECGAGPMTSATFGEAITVNFQNGTLVGWNLSGQNDRIGTVGGFSIGTPRAAVEVADGFDLIEGSTLGEEFTFGAGFAGFFEAGEVSMLYAGTQCFFR